MCPPRSPLAVLGLLLVPVGAFAQGPFVPFLDALRGTQVVGRVGPLTFSYSRTVGFGSPGCNPYCPPPLGRVSVVYYAPPPVIVPPPIIVQAPPPRPLVLVVPRGAPDDFGEDLDFDIGPLVPPERPLPGNRAPARAPAKPKGADARKPPAPPRQPAELPRGPRPLDDPAEELQRLLTLGREAFAAQEYGRAAEFFGRAARGAPREALPPFLLAQAQFALGKYGQAVESLRAGLKLKPDWPAARFRPIELYGPNVIDLPQHLHQLEEAVARRPEDPVLLFLYGYQLWFDGRKEEARPWLERAARFAADRGDVDLFLRALPGGLPVVIR